MPPMRRPDFSSRVVAKSVELMDEAKADKSKGLKKGKENEESKDSHCDSDDEKS